MTQRRVVALSFCAYLLVIGCSGCLGGSMAMSDGKASMMENDPGYDTMRNKSEQPSGDGILKLLAAIMLVGGLGSLATMRLSRQFEKDDTSTATGSGADPHAISPKDIHA